MSGTRQALNEFFCDVQKRAFRQAELATGNKDDALEMVQEAMLKLAQKYSEKEALSWPLIFQRILQNQLRDWHRRQKVRRVLFWWEQHDQSEEQLDLNEWDKTSQAPCQINEHHQIAERVHLALEQLPLRQQQAFLLRSWWGHDVAETAYAMGCSEGSVKTHYSRAIQRLRTLLTGVEL